MGLGFSLVSDTQSQKYAFSFLVSTGFTAAALVIVLYF